MFITYDYGCCIFIIIAILLLYYCMFTNIIIKFITNKTLNYLLNGLLPVK